MKEITFVGSAYESRSLAADHQRCVNLFVEKDAANETSMLLGTPGTSLQYTLPHGPVRGMVTMGSRTFVVGADTLYETTGGVPVALGTLSTGTGRVSIAAGDTQMLIVDGVAGYTYGPTFAKIMDLDFPNGVTKAAWEGEFFIVGADGSKQFYVSALNDDSSWDGLDFASAVNKPETIVSLTVSRDRLMLFTATGVESWANTGNSEFAFERDNGSSIEIGCEARDSVVNVNSGVMWLGRDRDGGRIVISHQGTPQRVSTHAIEHLLSKADVYDAYAMAYQQEGHTFYCLTVPALERTLVYDIATGQWHERAYWNGSGYERWRPAFHVYNGKHLAGDYATGDVYALDLDEPLDNGHTIRRLRTTTATKSNMARQFFAKFQLDCEVGTAAEGACPQVMLRYSDDGGYTWSNERMASIGKVGEYRRRVVFNRCGMGRERVWEVSITDGAPVALYGAYVDATVEAG